MHTNEQSRIVSSQEAGAGTSGQILEAVAYLSQCNTSQRGLAVLTGNSSATTRLVLKRFLASVEDASQVARILAPTDSRHAFLEAILAQLGFEPFESSADDLQRLLNVVLRQGASQKATTVILVEDAHQFGPRVLELIRDLIRSSRNLDPPPFFILTGKAALHQVLDSRGMASLAGLTRLRFDLDGRRPASIATAAPTPDPEPGIEPCLILTLENARIGRFPIEGERLLIGRGEHCDIPILSRFVSRQHALLLRNASGDWIIDLKSTNGTSVNSVLVKQRLLAHGDIIGIGNHRLQYHHPTASPISPVAEPRDEQLGETTVMRSLQALIKPAENHRR